jgi:hypothetical protein
MHRNIHIYTLGMGKCNCNIIGGKQQTQVCFRFFIKQYQLILVYIPWCILEYIPTKTLTTIAKI